MREMKDSGVEWIGKIPQGWKLSSIKREYKYQTGWTPSTEKDEYFEGEHIWVNISDMRERIIYDSVKHISDEASRISSMSISPAGSLLFAFKLSIGNVAFAGRDLYTNEAIATFLPGKNSLNYLYYAAPIFITENANENIYGAKLLNQQLISNARILIPSFDTQRRIAAYLDAQCARIDRAIARQQEVIEKLKEYKLAVITEAVTKGLNPDVPMKDSGIEWIGKIPEGWGVSKIKYLAQIQPQCSFEGLEPDSYITYAPMEFIKQGYFINTEARFCELSTSLTAFQEGDIVLAKVTPCFENGNIAIMTELYSGVGLGSSELFVFRPRGINVLYLLYWLQNDLFKQLGCATMTGTGGLKRVSPYFVANCVIHLPPDNDQEMVVRYLNEKCSSIEQIIAKKRLIIDKLTEYKKSQIYEVVTGKREV